MSDPPASASRPPRHVAAGTRAIAAFGCGFALWLLLPDSMATQTRVLAGWNGAVGVFLLLVLLEVGSATPDQLRQWAGSLVAGRASVLAVVLVACIVSVAAVTFLLRSVTGQPEGAGFHANLSVLSVLSSWFLLQTMFALFYARHYYQPLGDDVVKGLEFSGPDGPDFWDFVYFSFTIGFSYSTSDTGISSSTLRRAVLVQALVSFLFYTLLIGLVINAILQAL